ncbi:AraC family transcriptional regulator [Oryzomonas japonica]|uniref:AraC family transcriptional regulator n=1 Tax=Oryzomonas japonica TaxID=2603858 RepID=A0A7J4ZSG4_9BACT|nr:AraC family transcriptional regulator [Oryzomonas japonica]KAB0666003.1 AraC family transcriptional regulator [Oryzomonas japonica]
MKRNQQKELAARLGKYSSDEGRNNTAIPQLHCFKLSKPTAKTSVVYSPCLSLVVQGKKEAELDGETYRYAASEFLVVSVDLPVTCQITAATVESPYLCLLLDIDPVLLSDLMLQTDEKWTDKNDASRGLFVGKVDDLLADCAVRLVRFLDTPRDIPLLAPLVIREIYYRLLMSHYGQAIAQIAIVGSITQRIAQVIHLLKTNFSKPIRVEDMAEMANMSLSSFHFHFKEVTALSPLQYLKRMRLLEARRLMLSDGTDAANAGYLVGYESSSQFSREYSRMFGTPPIRDITNLRASQGLW